MTIPVVCPLLILGSYLLGSVSSAILVTRLWTGKNIHTLGNRNAGGANVARSVGLLPAALVSLVDFSKGALPVYVAQRLGLGDACVLGGAVSIKVIPTNDICSCRRLFTTVQLNMGVCYARSQPT